VDTTAPQTSMDSGPSGTTNDSTPTFGFTSNEAGSTFECRLGGAAFTPCTSPLTTSTLTDGAYTFEVRATDLVGSTDQTPAARSFTVDTTAPQTTIDAGPSGTTNVSTPTFGFSSSETGSSFECRVDNAVFTTCTTPLTTAALGDGLHTFEVRATDAVGNTDQTPASRSFTVATVPVDTSAPSVTCSATPSILKGTGLKSNNHKLIQINTTVTVTDETGGSGAAGFTLVSATSSQADSGLARDDVAGDIQGWTVGTADTGGLVRQERYGTDRVYTLTYQGRDNAGNTATCKTTVTVNK
ncbi:MAG: Ig-like domain-containing protein, partial [Acidimicrobiales bacterium]